MRLIRGIDLYDKNGEKKEAYTATSGRENENSLVTSDRSEVRQIDKEIK